MSKPAGAPQGPLCLCGPLAEPRVKRPKAAGTSGHNGWPSWHTSGLAHRRRLPRQPLAPAGILPNSGLRSRLRMRFRAASEAAEGCGNERPQRPAVWQTSGLAHRHRLPRQPLAPAGILANSGLRSRLRMRIPAFRPAVRRGRACRGRPGRGANADPGAPTRANIPFPAIFPRSVFPGAFPCARAIFRRTSPEYRSRDSRGRRAGRRAGSCCSRCAG